MLHSIFIGLVKPATTITATAAQDLSGLKRYIIDTCKTAAVIWASNIEYLHKKHIFLRSMVCLQVSTVLSVTVNVTLNYVTDRLFESKVMKMMLNRFDLNKSSLYRSSVTVNVTIIATCHESVTEYRQKQGQLLRIDKRKLIPFFIITFYCSSVCVSLSFTLFSI